MQKEYVREEFSQMLEHGTIPRICNELHMITTGSSDDPTLRNSFVEYLKYRMKTWKPDTKSKDFDDAVYNLILVTLNEAGELSNKS